MNKAEVTILSNIDPKKGMQSWWKSRCKMMEMQNDGKLKDNAKILAEPVPKFIRLKVFYGLQNCESKSYFRKGKLQNQTITGLFHFCLQYLKF